MSMERKSHGHEMVKGVADAPVSAEGTQVRRYRSCVSGDMVNPRD